MFYLRRLNRRGIKCFIMGPKASSHYLTSALESVIIFLHFNRLFKCLGSLEITSLAILKDRGSNRCRKLSPR